MRKRRTLGDSATHRAHECRDAHHPRPSAEFSRQSNGKTYSQRAKRLARRSGCCRENIVPLGREKICWGGDLDPGTDVPGYTIDVPTALLFANVS
jgi:hypothetical protein